MGVLVLSALGTAQPWNHDPSSPIGPFRWGSLAPAFATCGDAFTGEVGKKQTPIHIVTATTIPASFPAGSFVLNYHETPLVVENTGHVIEVPFEPGSSLSVGASPTDTYRLIQFHFHAPSEHAVNGVLYDAELHLVHANAIGELAVVGVLLQSSTVGLPMFDTIMANAPIAPGHNDVLRPGVNPADLLPADKGFYRYAGSLTTPPCSESVQWFVMKNPVPITSAALATMHTIIGQFPNYLGFPNNNRPIVNLNGRTVLRSDEPTAPGRDQR